VPLIEIKKMIVKEIIPLWEFLKSEGVYEKL